MTTQPPRRLTTGVDDGEFLVDTSTALSPLNSADAVQAASDGSDYLVVWKDNRRTEGIVDWPDVYCARVTASGALLDSCGIVLYDGDAEAGQFAVGFDGTNYAVTWVAGESLYFARVTQSGVVLDPGGRGVCSAYSTWPWYPSGLAFDGQHFLAVWSQWVGGDFDEDIYGIRIDCQGNRVDSLPFAIVHFTDTQYHPRIVFADDYFFVVWLDCRNYPNSALYGARVSRAGVVLDTAGILVDSTRNPWAPELTTDGSNYLVGRFDNYDGSSYCVSVSRVSQDGTVLDGVPIELTRTAADELAPALSFHDSCYRVVWWDDRNSGWPGPFELYGSLVSRSGHVLTPDGVRIGDSLDWDSQGTCLGQSQSGLLVTWDGGYASRLDFDLQELDPTPVLVAHGARPQSEPCVGSGSGPFLTAWYEDRLGENDIYAARIDPSGVILDPVGFKVNSDTGSHSGPAVAFDSADFLVVWQRNGVYGARVSRSGTVLDIPPIMISQVGGSPSVAFDGHNFVCAFCRNSVFRCARISPAGTLLDTSGIQVLTLPSDLDASAASTCVAAGNGLSLLACLTESLEIFYLPPPNPPEYVWVNHDMRLSRLNQSGQVLDTEGIILGRGGTALAAAFDGDRYLVAWANGESAYAARVAPTGHLVDSLSPLRVGRTDGAPSVAFDVSAFLVVYQQDGDIEGVRLDSAGNRLGPFTVVEQPSTQESPAVAVSPLGQELVVYRGWTHDYGGHTYNDIRIWGKFGRFPGVEERSSARPNELALSVWPNPAVGRSVVRYSLPMSRRVNIRLYEVSGRLARTLHQGVLEAGTRKVVVDMSGLAPGVYILMLTADNCRISRKLVLQ